MSFVNTTRIFNALELCLKCMQVLEQLSQGASVAVISDAGDTLAGHILAHYWSAATSLLYCSRIQTNSPKFE